MRFGLGVAALLLGLAALIGSSLQRSTPQAAAGAAAAAIASAVQDCGGSGDAAAARGTGFGNWWHKHGQEVVEFTGCMLAGGGLARLLIAGVSGVGGLLAAAGLVVGVLACLA